MLATLTDGVIGAADAVGSGSPTTLTTSVTPTNAANHCVIFAGIRRPDKITWNTPSASDEGIVNTWIDTEIVRRDNQPLAAFGASISNTERAVLISYVLEPAP
jgi:hypothetical protein